MRLTFNFLPLLVSLNSDPAKLIFDTAFPDVNIYHVKRFAKTFASVFIKVEPNSRHVKQRKRFPGYLVSWASERKMITNLMTTFYQGTGKR